MKNTSNVLNQTQCELSNYVFCHASVSSGCSKAEGKLTLINNAPSLNNNGVQLNQKKATLTFYDEEMNLLFITKGQSLEGSELRSKQFAQPLKHLNTIVSDTVSFSLFCTLLITTGMFVWVNLS